MTPSQEPESTSAATIHAVSLPPESTIPVLDAAEVSGFGFRQYPTIDSLLQTAAPSSQGCVLISGGLDQSSGNAVAQLQAHFHTIPIIVVLESSSADLAVEFMRQGVFFVLTKPLEHQKVVAAITSAVDFSIRNQGAIDSCRAASLRMAEATEKEMEVLTLIMQGRKNKEIAGILGVTVRAIEDRRFRLMKKVGVESVAELVSLAVTAQYHDQGIRPGTLHHTASTEPQPCVRGIEIWTPTSGEANLELTQSCYRDAAAFQEASRGMTFRRGEGLPGDVWEKRTPAFLKEIITSDFVRSGAAGAAGMTTAVGFPIFSNERIVAVILILLDSRHGLKAAFESWRMDPVSDALRLVSGTYINCERLRRLSEFMHLPIGEGLAGFTLEQARPYLSARFAEDPHAVRGLALAAEQLVSGIALPLTDSGSINSDVFVLLNSESNPVFAMQQVWKMNGSGLTLAAEYVDGVPSLTAQMAKAQPMQDSIAFECWNTGRPIIADNGHAERIVHSPSAPSPKFGIAIPTQVKGQVMAVTVLAN